MNENLKLYKYKDRVLIIDRTGDALTHALISCELDIEGIVTSLYTLNTFYESGSLYINPFKYHQGHEHLANILFPLKKKNSDVPSAAINKKRTACSRFLKAHQLINENPLSIDSLISVLEDKEKLKSLSDEAFAKNLIPIELELISNKALISSVLKVLKEIRSDPILSSHTDFEFGKGFMCNDKKEIDLKEMNDNGYMIYIYTPHQPSNSYLSESLIINNFKSASMFHNKPIPTFIKDKLLKVYERLSSSITNIK
jgi:hypothetical protein